jgi:hypothetical protein
MFGGLSGLLEGFGVKAVKRAPMRLVPRQAPFLEGRSRATAATLTPGIWNSVAGLEYQRDFDERDLAIARPVAATFYGLSALSAAAMTGKALVGGGLSAALGTLSDASAGGPYAAGFALAGFLAQQAKERDESDTKAIDARENELNRFTGPGK